MRLLQMSFGSHDVWGDVDFDPDTGMPRNKLGSETRAIMDRSSLAATRLVQFICKSKSATMFGAMWTLTLTLACLLTNKLGIGNSSGNGQIQPGSDKTRSVYMQIKISHASNFT